MRRAILAIALLAGATLVASAAGGTHVRAQEASDVEQPACPAEPVFGTYACIVVDAAPEVPGFQAFHQVDRGARTFSVDVWFLTNRPSGFVTAFQFALFYDLSWLEAGTPMIPLDDEHWNCEHFPLSGNIPEDDPSGWTDGDAGTGNAVAGCFVDDQVYTVLMGDVRLGTIEFTPRRGGYSEVTLQNALVGDEGGVELAGCFPAGATTGAGCLSAAIANTDITPTPTISAPAASATVEATSTTVADTFVQPTPDATTAASSLPQLGSGDRNRGSGRLLLFATAAFATIIAFAVALPIRKAR